MEIAMTFITILCACLLTGLVIWPLAYYELKHSEKKFKAKMIKLQLKLKQDQKSKLIAHWQRLLREKGLSWNAELKNSLQEQLHRIDAEIQELNNQAILNRAI